MRRVVFETLNDERVKNIPVYFYSQAKKRYPNVFFDEIILTVGQSKKWFSFLLGKVFDGKTCVFKVRQKTTRKKKPNVT